NRSQRSAKADPTAIRHPAERAGATRMKRSVVLSLALLAAACSRAPSDMLQGYGEADYIYLASQETGVVSELLVREGDRVEAGARVFALDTDRLALNEQSASAQSAAAASAVRTAQAQA